MARQASKDVRRLLQIEKIQAYVERHMQEAEENVSRSAKQYVRDLCERFGDPYRGFREPADINLNSIEEIMRKDPLLGIPVSARDLLESSAVPKGMDMGQIDRLSIPYEGLISKCHVVGITKSELTGHPLQAEEVHTGPGGPTLPVPECYAWAQPNLGRLEIVSHLANTSGRLVQLQSLVGPPCRRLSASDHRTPRCHDKCPALAQWPDASWICHGTHGCVRLFGNNHAIGKGNRRRQLSQLHGGPGQQSWLSGRNGLWGRCSVLAYAQC
jgi:hypothetical protein